MIGRFRRQCEYVAPSGSGGVDGGGGGGGGIGAAELGGKLRSRSKEEERRARVRGEVDQGVSTGGVGMEASSSTLPPLDYSAPSTSSQTYHDESQRDPSEDRPSLPPNLSEQTPPSAPAHPPPASIAHEPENVQASVHPDEQARRMREVRALLGRLPPELEGLLRAHYREEDQRARSRGGEEHDSMQSRPWSSDSEHERQEMQFSSECDPTARQVQRGGVPKECDWESERRDLKRKAARAEEECERLRGEVKRRRVGSGEVRRAVRRMVDEGGRASGAGDMHKTKNGTGSTMKGTRSGSKNGRVVEVQTEVDEDEDEGLGDEMGPDGDVAMEDRGAYDGDEGNILGTCPFFRSSSFATQTANIPLLNPSLLPQTPIR